MDGALVGAGSHNPRKVSPLLLTDGFHVLVCFCSFVAPFVA
jgi:hypothetical protein